MVVSNLNSIALQCVMQINFVYFLFQIIRDLRGNMFQCDCESMWLMLWLKRSNATISDVYCASPSNMKGVLLKDVPEKHSKCVSTGDSSDGF